MMGVMKIFPRLPDLVLCLIVDYCVMEHDATTGELKPYILRGLCPTFCEACVEISFTQLCELAGARRCQDPQLLPELGKCMCPP